MRAKISYVTELGVPKRLGLIFEAFRKMDSVPVNQTKKSNYTDRARHVPIRASCCAKNS